MSPGKGIDPRVATYCLEPREAVRMAYIQAVHGAGELVPANERHERHHAEAEALVKESRTKSGVFHIILPDGRAWFGFPEKGDA
jgi:hypothetical protein